MTDEFSKRLESLGNKLLVLAENYARTADGGSQDKIPYAAAAAAMFASLARATTKAIIDPPDPG